MKIHSKASTAKKELMAEFELDDSSCQILLDTFARAYTVELTCEEILAKDCFMVTDRFGIRQSHPLLKTLKAARAQKLAALRALNLDIIPTRLAPGRPGGR